MRANADLLEMTAKGKADVFFRVFTRLHIWLRNYFDLGPGRRPRREGAIRRGRSFRRTRLLLRQPHSCSHERRAVAAA